MKWLTDRLMKTATLISQLGNVWIFGGSTDETISGRAYREGKTNPVWAKRRKFLNSLFMSSGHCQRSHMSDVYFAKMIMESRYD